MHPALVAAAAAAEAQLDTVTVSALLSLLMPLAVSFITKREATDGLKALTNIVATALLAAIVIFLVPPDGVAVTWQLIANTFLASLLASFMAYKGIWKPTGVTASIAQKSANVGIGSPPTVETDAGLVENEGVSPGAASTPGAVDDTDSPNADFDWSSIPSADGEPARLDRDHEMIPNEEFHPELQSIEERLTAKGDSPEGQAFRDSQGGS